MAKEIRSGSCNLWTSFLFVALLNLQTFGEGLDFCFDGSKEGGFRFIESIYEKLL
jgi:hypothetical protein